MYIYTRENFYIFQKEIWMSCVYCGIENKKEEDGMEIFHVHDNSKVSRNLREVVYNLSNRKKKKSQSKLNEISSTS